MVITKDTDEQIVLRQSTGRRILWGSLGGFGGAFIVAMGVLGAAEVIWAGIGLICAGLVFILGGLCLSAHFKQITFDHSLGYVTIRAGAGPFPLRTRRISKTELEGVHVEFLSGSERWDFLSEEPAPDQADRGGR